MILGVNTYGMGRLLKAGFRQTFRILKENGVTAAEPCVFFPGKKPGVGSLIGLGMKLSDRLGGVWAPAEAKEKIEQLRADGFRIEGAHLFGGLAEDEIDTALSFAKENALQYYVLSVMTDRIPQAAKQLPMLRRAVRAFRDQGVHLLLHNHDMDLRETDGQSVLDFLLQNVPELELELDLGWAAYALLDCPAAMDRYRDRLRVLHFKDMWPSEAAGKPHFCAVGEGRLPLSAIMEKAQELSLFPAGFIIDQDSSENDLMAEILSGAAHIRAAEAPQHPVYDGKLSLSMLTFPLIGEVLRRSLRVEELCEMARGHGLCGLDLMEAEIALYGKARLKAALKDHGLSLNCLIATVSMGTLPAGLIRALIKKHLHTAREFGCGKLMLIPMPQNERMPVDAEKRAARKARVIRFLNEAVAEARSFGVTVCVEDTPSCDIPLCSIEDCRRTLEAVPGLGLVFDTANMLPRGEGPLAFYEALKEHICQVHLKDALFTDTPNADRCVNGRYLRCVPWGEGLVPVRALMERLEQDGFAGVCALEYVAPEGKGLIANHKQLEHFLR